MSYRAALLEPHMEAAYDEFYERLSSEADVVLAYHHLCYRDVLFHCLGPDVVARYWVVLEGDLESSQENRICAALPSFAKLSAIGPSYCSLPFFGPNAGVICSFSHPDAHLWHKLLLGAALAEATAAGAWSFSFHTPLAFSHFDWYEEALGQPIIALDKFTQCMRLSEPESWSGKIWYDIRRAERGGLEVVNDPTPEHMEQYWALYTRNCTERQIPPKPRAGFDAILGTMRPRGLAQFLVAVDPSQGGCVVAGLLNLTSRRTVSYYMPAHDESYRRHQPMALLIRHAAAEATAGGLTVWNWESSPSRESGVYRYKARWGSDELGYRIYVKPLRELDQYMSLGAEGIASHFPFFFVYPFPSLTC